MINTIRNYFGMEILLGNIAGFVVNTPVIKLQKKGCQSAASLKYPDYLY